MSNEAMGWAFKHSPYTGAALLVHLAIADSVNDQHGYELWMRQSVLAEKARVSRKAVNDALERMEADGLVVPADGVPRAQRAERPDGRPVRFVMNMPTTLKVVYDPKRRGVTGGDTQGVTAGDTGCNQRSQGGVTGGDTEPKEPKEPKRGRAVQVPDDFEPSPSSREWATRKFPRVGLALETEQFINHHRSKGSTFKDIDAAWKNWVIKADKWDRGTTNGNGHRADGAAPVRVVAPIVNGRRRNAG